MLSTLFLNCCSDSATWTAWTANTSAPNNLLRLPAFRTARTKLIRLSICTSPLNNAKTLTIRKLEMLSTFQLTLEWKSSTVTTPLTLTSQEMVSTSTWMHSPNSRARTPETTQRFAKKQDSEESSYLNILYLYIMTINSCSFSFAWGSCCRRSALPLYSSKM